MKNQSTEYTAATSAKHFDAMLAISTIYFNGIGELSELALTSARETVDECLSATSAAATGEASAVRAKLGQPMLARIVANSTECVQIVSRSQQEAAAVLARQFSLPFMQTAMPIDVSAAMEMFSSGLKKLATINASNLAAVTEVASGVGEKIVPQPKKAA